MPPERRFQSAGAAGAGGSGVGHHEPAAIVVTVHVVARAHGVPLRLQSIQQGDVIGDDPGKEGAVSNPALVHVEALCGHVFMQGDEKLCLPPAEETQHDFVFGLGRGPFEVAVEVYHTVAAYTPRKADGVYEGQEE